MNFFKDLPLKLLNSSSALHQQQRQVAEEASETGDLELFYRLSTQVHYTDFAHQEQGRINHQILRTTFDSFQ